MHSACSLWRAGPVHKTEDIELHEQPYRRNAQSIALLINTALLASAAHRAEARRSCCSLAVLSEIP